MSEQKLKIELTTRQTLELAALCGALTDVDVISDCFQILIEALREQAAPDDVVECIEQKEYFAEFVK